MKSIPLATFLISVIFWCLGAVFWFFNRDIFILTGILSFYFTCMVWLEFSSNIFQANIKNIFVRYFPYLFLVSFGMVAAGRYYAASILVYMVFSALAIVFGLGSITFNIYEPEGHSVSKRKYDLFLFFLIILVVYLYINMSNHNIDTDEIRLLFDAKLITQGFVPFRDFISRSPALIYMLAFLYHFFGNKIIFYRIFTAVVAWGSGVFLYLIGKRFLSRAYAILLVSFYAFLPVFLNFLYIKTETFSVFFGLLSVLLYVLSFEIDKRIEKRRWMRILSHLSILVALLIRPTAIVFYVFHILICVDAKRREVWKSEIRKLCIEICSTVIVFATSTFLFFKSHNSLFYTNSFKSFGIDYNSYTRFLLTPNYIPISIFVLCAIMLLDLFQRNIIKKSKLLLSALVILILLICAYIANAFLLGFWPQYYMDFAVPACILAMYCFINISQVLGGISKNIIFCSILMGMIFISFLPSYISLDEYFLSGNLNTITLDEVSHIIDQNTKQDAVIFGGNPVFAFLSDRKQFLNLSHSYYDFGAVSYVIKKLYEHKPDLIIIDSYYMNRFYVPDPTFVNLLSSCYIKIDDSIVYKLISTCRD